MEQPIQNSIFYSLDTDDIQTVAEEELDRRLSEEEIESIKESIAEKIDWYDAIAETIREKIKN